MFSSNGRSCSSNNAFKVLLNQDNSEKYIYLKGPSKSGKSHIGRLWQKINNANWTTS